MSVKNESKINQLLQEVPAGAVYLTSWMKQNNIPHSTQHRYVESAWLTPIGTGAMSARAIRLHYTEPCTASIHRLTNI